MGTKVNFTAMGIVILLSVLIGFEVITYYAQRNLSLEKREMIATIQSRDQEIVKMVEQNKELLLANSAVLEKLNLAIANRDTQVAGLVKRNSELLKINSELLSHLKVAIDQLRETIPKQREEK